MTKEEMQGIPHYLVDCIDPREPYSAADFQKKASEIITRENKEGRIPGPCGRNRALYPVASGRIFFPA